MEPSHDDTNQGEDGDRLSGLTDDILLSILGRVDTCTAVKAGMLSTRWRHLPWLLRELNINVLDFLHCQPSEGTKTLLEEAMTALSKTTSNFLAVPKDECIIKRLRLAFYLTDSHMSDLGRLISEAIEDEKVKNVELVMVTYRHRMRCSDDDMIQYGERLACFLGACPSLFRCLTMLDVENVCFDESEMDYLLGSCEQLHHLVLTNCDTGYGTVLKVDFLNSKLCFLEFRCCGFERIELICLPKLEYLSVSGWTSVNLPLAFDFVPCLKKLRLVTACEHDFKLSKMLGETTSIETLAMDFEGERIWIQPEGKELGAAFKKLRKLFIHGIYVEFSLLWTIALLEAAPSLQMLDIQVYDHPCDDNDGVRDSYPERTNASWEAFKFNGSQHRQLKILKLNGFMEVEKQMEFIRAIMEQAIVLETVLLEDKDPCDRCDALSGLHKESYCNAVNNPTSSMKSRFPKNMDEQTKIVNKLKDGHCSSAQIVFQSLHVENSVRRYL